MKTKLIILVFFGLFTSTVFAQTTPAVSAKIVTANIKVLGNCGMCKDRIEKALDTKGVKQAKWNIATKNLEVVYVPEKITVKQIRELVSAAGHDTDSTKAKDAVYAKLPFCCLYRDHDHSGIEDKKKDGHE
ncbi:MAG TPA: heavy metal-associated domain-containing protein [Cyclobacteriaceae bacterium]|nr:heavy metal-associated domain-containing protein [Cyclobacteriaceae bacterium]